MPNYVKIPREIIYNRDIGDKRVIIFSYLCSRRALDDTVAFSISELCHWSHLKPNYHDGKINQKYLEVLELLSHYMYFTDYPDFLTSSVRVHHQYQLPALIFLQAGVYAPTRAGRLFQLSAEYTGLPVLIMI